MLTISQLAATAGVTVRTVRHYHQVGLLPEPGRDASGYRRYDAQAAVDLIRIRTLAEAGVPLARIEALLRARPAEFAAAVADIDAELQRKAEQLAEHRRRIADLASGERPALPPQVVAILERMRALGVSERAVLLERDTWILLQALDPETVRLFLVCDQSMEWDPYDPRVDALIEDLDAWEVAHGRDSSEPGNLEVIFSRIAESSPAWQRILSVLTHRARQRRAA